MNAKQLKWRKSNFRWILCLMLSSCLMMISCNKTDEGGDNGEDPQEKFYQVYGSTNPYDQIIALIFSKDNDTIMVFGDKDENAVPLGIKEMIIRQNDAEGRTTIKFDDLQRPVDFTAPNGVRMLLEWLDESSAAITMIDPLTEDQVNTVVSFDDRNLSRRWNHPSTPRKGEAKMSLRYTSSNMSENDNGIAQLIDNKNIIGYVNGSSCGEVGTYYVKAFMMSYDEHGFGRYDVPIGTFNCVHVSGDRYMYTIPKAYFGAGQIDDDIREICDEIEKILGELCTIYNGWFGPAAMAQICTAISLTGAGTLFGIACAGITSAITAYCSTLGNSPMPGGSSISQELGLCSIIQDVVVANNSVKLVAYGYKLPNDISGSSTIFSGQGQPNDLYVDSGGNPAIASFTLNPPAPLAGQSYLAIAHLECLPEGTSITMSIVGTDEYTDLQTQYISESTPYVDATLYVPGAVSGVRDVCTTTVVLPDGATLTKTASLVFQ